LVFRSNDFTPMPEVLWYYAKNDQQLGPVSPSELRQLAAQRQLAPEDLIWREGMEGWAPAARVKGLFPEAKPENKEPPAAPEPLSSALTATMPPTAVAEILSSAANASPSPAGSAIAADVFATTPPAAPEPRASATAAKSVEPTNDSPGIEVFDLLWLGQTILWAICILVIFVGGLLFAVALARAEDSVEKAAAAATFASFAIAAYITARAGERTAALLQMYYERRRR
jgi:uncharacterized membrane protein